MVIGWIRKVLASSPQVKISPTLTYKLKDSKRPKVF